MSERFIGYQETFSPKESYKNMRLNLLASPPEIRKAVARTIITKLSI